MSIQLPRRTSQVGLEYAEGSRLQRSGFFDDCEFDPPARMDSRKENLLAISPCQFDQRLRIDFAWERREERDDQR